MATGLVLAAALPAFALPAFAWPEFAWADTAAPQFSALFSDHAVLQRGEPVHVWGTATPSHALSLGLNGQTVTTRTDATGHWKADLPAMTAGGPYELSISDNGAITKLSDIMVGDVFLCTGQSNMQFPVKYATNAWGEIYTPANPNLRYMAINNDSQDAPVSEVAKPTAWKTISGATSGDASAVCYYMSKAIQKQQNVPVGFIQSFWGGTTIQAWISADTLKAINYQGSIAPSQWAPSKLSSLYNGMIAPLSTYNVKAVAWYQGESNTSQAADYAILLPALMRDWRQTFNKPVLPFLIVQLANFGSVATKPVESNWAAVREAQRRAVDADPHAALAVTIDFGDRSDIHPTEKTVIGNRLARAAQNVVYGEKISPTGPEATAVTRSGDDLVVHFKNATGGLLTYSANTAIGFEACEAATCAYVTATVQGDAIVLKGANKPTVTRVRYAWADAPYTNLYSGDDLPAVPFQMDVH